MLAPTEHTPSALKWGVGDEKLRQHKTIDPAVASNWTARYSEHRLAPETLRLMDAIGVVRQG